MKINGIGVAKLVKRTEMDAPRIGQLEKESEVNDSKVGKFGKVGKLVQKIGISDPRSGKLVKKDETGDPKVVNIGVVWKIGDTSWKIDEKYRDGRHEKLENW